MPDWFAEQKGVKAADPAEDWFAANAPQVIPGTENLGLPGVAGAPAGPGQQLRMPLPTKGIIGQSLARGMGGGDATRGRERMAQAEAPGQPDTFPIDPGAVQSLGRGTKNIITGEGPGGRVRAARDIIGGGLGVLSSAPGMAMVAPPAKALLKAGAYGMAAQQGAERGLTAAGVDPEVSGLVGDVAGVVVGGPPVLKRKLPSQANQRPATGSMIPPEPVKPPPPPPQAPSSETISRGVTTRGVVEEPAMPEPVEAAPAPQSKRDIAGSIIRNPEVIVAGAQALRSLKSPIPFSTTAAVLRLGHKILRARKAAKAGIEPMANEAVADAALEAAGASAARPRRAPGVAPVWRGPMTGIPPTPPPQAPPPSAPATWRNYTGPVPEPPPQGIPSGTGPSQWRGYTGPPSPEAPPPVEAPPMIPSGKGPSTWKTSTGQTPDTFTQFAPPLEPQAPPPLDAPGRTPIAPEIGVGAQGKRPEPQAPPPLDQPPPQAEPPITAKQQTIPERPETLALQLEQLASGQRKAVLVPPGSPITAAAAGTSRVRHMGNEVIFDPKRISAENIRQAIENNQLPQVLGSAERGMGAPDKSQIQGKPLAVIGRTESGTTAQGTLTDLQRLPGTFEATKDVTPEGGKISIEEPEVELARRLQPEGPPPQKPPKGRPAPGTEGPADWQAEYQQMVETGWNADPGNFPGAQAGAPFKIGRSKGQSATGPVRTFPAEQLPELAKAEGVSVEEVRANLKEDGWLVRGETYQPVAAPKPAASFVDRMKALGRDLVESEEGSMPSVRGRPADLESLMKQQAGLKPKGTGESGKVLLHDLGAALDGMIHQRFRRGPYSSPAVRKQRAIERLVSDFRYAAALEDNGSGWYTEKLKAMEAEMVRNRAEFQKPEKLSLFKYLLGITSSGVDPEMNFNAAMKGWDMYLRDGKFQAYDPTIPSKLTKPGKVDKGLGLTFRATSYEGAVARLNKLVQTYGEEGAVQWLQTKHPVSELKQWYDKVKGIKGQADQTRLGSYIFGEKVGAFGANLNGIHTELTADKWWTRTWNRWMGTVMATDSQGNPVLDKKTKLPTLEEYPRNAGERNLMREVITEVATKLNMDVSELQAVLWYTEQALYRQYGIDAFVRRMERLYVILHDVSRRTKRKGVLEADLSFLSGGAAR